MHRLVRIGGPVILILLTAGGGESGKTAPVPAEIGRLSKEGSQLLSQRRFPAAAQVFLRGAGLASALGDHRRHGLFLNAAAGSYFSAHRYRDAEAAYRSAVASAQTAGDEELQAVAHLNLASLFISLWEPDAGEAELQLAQSLLPPSSEHHSRLLALRLYLAARRGDSHAARSWGRAAAETADRLHQTALLAQIWDKLGDVALRDRQLDEAEDYLTAAFRLRKLNRLPQITSSYYSLARLRLAQSRVRDAESLVAAARSTPAGSPTWWTRYEHARLHLAAGRPGLALAEARAAVQAASGWRQSLLSSQWMQSAADVTETEAVRLLVHLLLARGDHASAREAFLVIESTRARTLRASALRNRWRQHRIPDEHGEILSQLAELEAASSPGSAPVQTRLQDLRARLVRLENEAGLDLSYLPVASPSFDQVRARLAPGEAYLSFFVDDRASWGWVLTRDSFSWGPLPGRGSLSASVNQTRSLLQHDQPAWQDESRSLAARWLPWAPPELWSARRWIVSADDALFAFPWTALDPIRPVTLVPVLSFREPRPPDWGGGLAAFGDSIYNLADPRRRAPRFRAPSTPLELPRLVGSGAEVRNVAATLRGARWTTSEHTGAEAGLDQLRHALQSRPAVVHLAAHFFQGPSPGQDIPLLSGPGAPRAARPREVFLAFSLRPDGSPQLLTARTVATTLQAPDAIIVLSGCGSGSGDVLPGAGLQGFAQAWLAAGARSVIASLWPVADDTGDFFEQFYRRLAAGQPAGDALAGARLASLRSGSWRARPSAWSGYFSMGKE